jgi:hypothetical protein
MFFSSTHNKAIVTNYLGSEAERTLLKSQISDTIFPKSTSRFINDLEGTCNGIKALNSQNKLSEFFELLWPIDTMYATKIAIISKNSALQLTVDILILITDLKDQKSILHRCTVRNSSYLS